MSCRMLPLLLAGAGVLSASLAVSAQPRGDTPRPLRAGVELVVVDVIVRDANGDVVRGLTANDFEVLEDGQPQTIVSFDFEEVVAAGSPAVVAPVLGAGLQPPPGVRADRDGRPREAPEIRAGAPEPRRLQDLAGRRLIVLLFDVSSMQPEDADEAIRSALVYVDERMTAADLVAVATVGSTLEVQSDFTADRERLRDALSALVATGEMAVAEAEVETIETDEQQVEAESGGVGTASEYDLFNNDVRLRAIRTVAENLQLIEQKKAIVYFSAGMRRSGGDNQVELRAAVNAAVRANAALYTVDARGLQAVVPGGDASRRSGRGRSLFSGQAMARQLDQLYSSQETLSTLADDTGGQAFTDTNDFGAVFAQVERDLSSYYLLGYQSPSRTRDGRYHRIAVRVKRPGLRVEHRAGYYAERDFAHTSRRDREYELRDQLQAPLSATDLPVLVSSGWFRRSDDRYDVPVSVVVPGSAVPVTAGDRVTLTILGVVRDEQGRPVGGIDDTMRVPRESTAELAGRQVLYQSRLTLPPGRFSLKVVVREDATGQIGSYETPLFVPDLSQAPVKVSSVTFGTQVREVEARRPENPLVRDGLELIPNVTHVVGRNQQLFVYYEVYDPRAGASDRPSVRTSLAFYRGGVKVYETPVIERTTLDEPRRGAVLFQFEIPAAQLLPGLYTCQINIIDEIGGTFVFPRLPLYVREGGAS